MDTVGFYIMMGVVALIGLIGIAITSIYNYVKGKNNTFSLGAQTCALKNNIVKMLKLKTYIKYYIFNINY